MEIFFINGFVESVLDVFVPALYNISIVIGNSYMRTMLALVTGEIGCGKTTACRRALDLLRARGVAPSGILSPPRLDATGDKIGIDVLDVATGEQRRLAGIVSSGGKTIGKYSFHEDALAWAIARLQAAVAAGPDLLVVDEIGPLELVRRGGFVATLRPLADPNCVPQGVVVVRREYVDVLDRLLGRADVCRFWVDEARRDGLPARMAMALG
jgi:nucleoside-triphosphatase THEP1